MRSSTGRALSCIAVVAAVILACAMQGPAKAQPNSSDVNARVAEALFYSSETQSALSRAQDARLTRMQAEISLLARKLKADEQGHAPRVILLAEQHDVSEKQSTFVEALAQRDPQFAEYRQKILRYADTPEGMAAILRDDSDSLFTSEDSGASSTPSSPNTQTLSSQALLSANILYSEESSAKMFMDSCQTQMSTNMTIQRMNPNFDAEKQDANCYRIALSMLNNLVVQSNASDPKTSAIDPSFKLQLKRDVAHVLARLASIRSSGARWSDVVEEYNAMRKTGVLTPEDETAATDAAEHARLERQP